MLYALDHKPDGSAWTYPWTSRDQIRNVPSWVRFRLSAWLDEHGRPVPGKSQQLAAAAAELRAEQDRWRARFESMNAQRVGGSIELAPRPSRMEALAPRPSSLLPRRPGRTRPTVRPVRRLTRSG
ncbi:hypothetical protein [Streptosporangium roseum]|uniref:hypothetical protein n=1 Tax=Streptosporangium roseum TaxID=2001 RepID=UPI0004CCD3DD|nr:hypothetical protein [Streptosporangium roseum]